MDEPTPAQGAHGKGRRVTVQICCTRVGHLTPYREWHNERQLDTVPELPQDFAEFIDTLDEDPGLSGEVLLREDEPPGPDREICRIGPPLPVAPCAVGGEDCRCAIDP
ncbi:hypothetical protein ABZ626_25090 [Streptomyces longispororuber]|uniref:hypothetical protein n=1 Tax=Streptomyces longispororuber TaxID=68230 RepID=UPI0033C254FF